MKKPELLAPAGNLEKLKIAFQFGADAVYMGTPIFGLRKYAPNATPHELRHGVSIARSLNKHVYLVLNGFAHDTDLDDLKTAAQIIQSIQPHALIISDIAVFEWAKNETDIPLHISTQASTLNWRGCEFWKKRGAKRIILGREASLEDCRIIQSHCPIELEIFCHGAMCASYSGKCVISNYTSGRDSNRGGCVQTCRHNFVVKTPELSDYSAHIMNARDLEGINQIPEIIQSNIDSVKIEGRMKSNLYLANATRTYRAAIDYCFSCLTSNESIDSNRLDRYREQLKKVSNRTFSSGGLDSIPGPDSINTSFNQYEKSTELIGTILSITPENDWIVHVKNGFTTNDTLTILAPDNDFTLTNFELKDLSGHPINKANSNKCVRVQSNLKTPALSILTRSSR